MKLEGKQKFLSKKITIHISEVETRLRVSGDIFNERGEKVRAMTDEEFNAALREARGETMFIIHAGMDGKMLTMESPSVTYPDRLQCLEVAMNSVCSGITLQLMEGGE